MCGMRYKAQARSPAYGLCANQTDTRDKRKRERRRLPSRRPLGTVRCARHLRDAARYRVYTSALSTESSARDLSAARTLRGSAHLGGGFALRCIQRFSVPDIAIRRRPGQGDRHTSGRAAPVLSYWERLPSTLLRPRRIETELSHDVLNPARVPL